MRLERAVVKGPHYGWGFSRSGESFYGCLAVHSIPRHNQYVAMMILLVGLPGSGKTTVAKNLATEHNALRLTPDEWMIPLFGEPEAEVKRDHAPLEGSPT